MKHKDKEQYLTETIAQDGGLQTDNRMYYDPIYKSRMYGGFLQSLYISKNHPYRKIFLSIVILVVPMLIADVIATQQAFFGDQNNFAADANKFGIVFFLYPLSILVYFIAIKIIVKAIKDKMTVKI